MRELQTQFLHYFSKSDNNSNHHHHELICFHNDEMPCEMDSTENPRLFEKYPTQPSRLIFKWVRSIWWDYWVYFNITWNTKKNSIRKIENRYIFGLEISPATCQTQATVEDVTPVARLILDSNSKTSFINKFFLKDGHISRLCLILQGNLLISAKTTSSVCVAWLY